MRISGHFCRDDKKQKNALHPTDLFVKFSPPFLAFVQFIDYCIRHCETALIFRSQKWRTLSES